MEDITISWALTAATGVAAMTLQDWIGFGFTIACGIASIAFTCWKWYHVAKEDGVITKDEVEDLIDQVQDEIDKTKKK